MKTFVTIYLELVIFILPWNLFLNPSFELDLSSFLKPDLFVLVAISQMDSETKSQSLKCSRRFVC